MSKKKFVQYSKVFLGAKGNRYKLNFLKIEKDIIYFTRTLHVHIMSNSVRAHEYLIQDMLPFHTPNNVSASLLIKISRSFK